MAKFDYQRQDSAEELLAGWMGELESVLYCSEVEEAIKEVSRARVHVKVAVDIPSHFRFAPVRVRLTSRTSTPLTISMNCFQMSRFVDPICASMLCGRLHSLVTQMFRGRGKGGK